MNPKTASHRSQINVPIKDPAIKLLRIWVSMFSGKKRKKNQREIHEL